jgi:tetratricopeptide (TPR) repeat protein
MKLSKLVFLFLFLSSAADAQVNLDSLRGIWNDVSQTDSVRLRAVHRIAWHGHLRSNPDSAFHYSQLQYAFAEQRGRKREMALALNTQGAVFEMKGDFVEAISRHEASLAIRSELGNVAGITASLSNIGNIHAFTGDHAKALEYYIRTVKVYEQDGDAQGKGMADVLNNIAATYHLQEDLPNALLYYGRSLNIREQLGLQDEVAQSLTNMGIVLQGMGELDSALVNFNRSLEIGIATGNR